MEWKDFRGINNGVTSGKWLGGRCTLLNDKQLQLRSVKSQWDTPAHLLFTSGNGLRSSIYSCVLGGTGQQCLSAIADDAEWDTTGEVVFKQGPQSEWYGNPHFSLLLQTRQKGCLQLHVSQSRQDVQHMFRHLSLYFMKNVERFVLMRCSRTLEHLTPSQNWKPISGVAWPFTLFLWLTCHF